MFGDPNESAHPVVTSRAPARYACMRASPECGLALPPLEDRRSSRHGEFSSAYQPAAPKVATHPYNRLVRLSERGIPVTIQLDLQSTLHEPRELANVIAELPGSTRKDEIVLIGARLDSWHGGTGATDNGDLA